MIGCHSCVFSDLDCRIGSPREKLTKAGAIGPLFERFDAMLRQSGYIAMAGQIVDASLIAAPRRRNAQDEKKAIRKGASPTTGKTSPRSSARSD
jgi:transposase, IS5 family